jgi:hypothetical protein
MPFNIDPSISLKVQAPQGRKNHRPNHLPPHNQTSDKTLMPSITTAGRSTNTHLAVKQLTNCLTKTLHYK